MTDFYAKSKDDNWTPDDGYRRALSKTIRPVVLREHVLPLAERQALAERVKAEEAAAEQRALRRRALFIEAMERKRERLRLEREKEEARRIELVRQATLGKLSMIVSEVGAEFGLKLQQMRSESRSAYFQEPRRKAAWRIWNEESASFTAIGRALNRDHSSIIHMIAMYAGPRGLPMPPCAANRWAKISAMRNVGKTADVG